MEGNKLEISGRTTTDPPPASYKKISDPDEKETFKERPKSLTKSLKSNNEMDGADEQMLPKEEKKVIGDVKFVSNNEKQNGEVKLDIGDLKTAFVGMSKEELMKYANDPFWIRLRWILFISFWLLWLAMLVGAIIIIIAAPKCAARNPRTWYEEGPIAELSTSQISDTKLRFMKENKVKAVIISKVKDSYKPPTEEGEILDLIKVAREQDLNVIVELAPAATDLWLNQSEYNDPEFADYYIWTDSSKKNLSGNPEPPNNWLAHQGGSAWRLSDTRNQFYYAPNYKAHLNFRNPKVISEFSKVIRQWIDVGVQGIRLRGANSLLVHEQFVDEPISNIPGFVHTDYQFYKHRGFTVDVEGIGEILKEWRTVVREYKDNNGPLLLEEDLNSLDSYSVNQTLSFDLPKHSMLFFARDKLNNASFIHKELNYAFSILGDNWPLWQIDERSEDLPADVLNILVSLLPGSVLVSQDVEIREDIQKLRASPTFMYGKINRELLANNTVFAYTRLETGNPGYLVACNPSNNIVQVDFTTMKDGIPEEITVQVLSDSFNSTDTSTKPNLKISAKNVQLSPKSALIATYVPKSSE